MAADETVPVPGSKPPEAAKVFDALKLDFATIKIIVLTAAVVFCLLLIPFLYILGHWITFEQVDDHFKVTAQIRPKILKDFPEEVDTGYSKNFFIDSPQSDLSLLFYSKKDERVSVSLQVNPYREGTIQPIKIQVNGQCTLPNNDIGFTQVSEYDLTKTLEKCPSSGELNLNTLRIIFPAGLKRGNTLQISCLVLVYQRVHEHIVEAQR